MKPFDPKTAKNGDVVVGCYSLKEFIYIGPDPMSVNNADPSVVVFSVKDNNYRSVLVDNLRIKPTKRIVWINIYGTKNKYCYWYDTKDDAESSADKESGLFIGTYPLEIEE